MLSHSPAFLSPVPLPPPSPRHTPPPAIPPACVARGTASDDPPSSSLPPPFSYLASLFARPRAPAAADSADPVEPAHPDDDGLSARLRARAADDDGLHARLAARARVPLPPPLPPHPPPSPLSPHPPPPPLSPPPRKRRRAAFPFFGRRPEPAELRVRSRRALARAFGALSEERVFELVQEAVRRRRSMGGDEGLATLLPYDLQRGLFDELLRGVGGVAVVAGGQVGAIGRVEREGGAKQRAAAEEGGAAEAVATASISKAEERGEEGDGGGRTQFGSVLMFPVRIAGGLLRVIIPWKDGGGTEDKQVKGSTAAVYAAAMSNDMGVSMEADYEGNSAAAAYAAAAAIASSASRTKLDRAEVAGLKAAVSAARAITTVGDATVFVDSIGVGPLITAAKLLPGAEWSASLTALANIAIMLPKSRLTMVKFESASIIDTLTNIVDQSQRFKVHQAVAGESALWHTEALVSGTHLLGSLALARGKAGTECRHRMARDADLVRGLQRLARGLKNGEPEGAARAARRALGTLGINTWKPRMPGQRGLRILSIDGGGTRAIMAFETLKQLKKTTGCEIHELFDVIGGTSTGAIVAASIGIAHKTVEEVELLYRDMIGKIFAKHPVNGPKMLLTRAYYDTGVLESTLQRECGKGVFIDSMAEENMNRVFVVSSIMSRNPKELHVFRNYTYPLGHESRYDGTVEAQLWEGLRASSAAPTFFSEIRVNEELHADGAIVANNPTAVALHEAKCMYPGVPIEVLVSLGNGLSPAYASNEEENEKKIMKNMGWGDVVGSILASATSTEVVHHAVQDLFPRDKYFRFNPTTGSTQIDETHPDTLAMFVQEAQDYIRENASGFEVVARILRPKTPRSLWRRFRDALLEEAQLLENIAWDDDPC